jgi:hypothetical protein
MCLFEIMKPETIHVKQLTRNRTFQFIFMADRTFWLVVCLISTRDEIIISIGVCDFGSRARQVLLERCF